jgi:hypothetical protein
MVFQFYSPLDARCDNITYILQQLSQLYAIADDSAGQLNPQLKRQPVKK